jgi:hypothetical protein
MRTFIFLARMREAKLLKLLHKNISCEEKVEKHYIIFLTVTVQQEIYRAWKTKLLHSWDAIMIT